jgi:ATP-dependent Lon protease
VDKVIQLTAVDRPLDILHSLWERENATAFVDEFYGVPFDISHAVSIATANSVDALPVSLLDRVLINDIPLPDRDQRRRIAVQIVQAALERLGAKDLSPLGDAELAFLAELSPRRMSRVVGLALPRAIAAGRKALTLDDLQAAHALLDAWRNAGRKPMGFLRHSRDIH